MEINCRASRGKHHLLLHMVLLCFVALISANEEAQVISFERNAELLPTGQSAYYTCVVLGRAVWKFNIFTIDTTIPTFSGNISGLSQVPDVNISDYTNSDGHHVSKLFFPAVRMQEYNGSDVTCSATSGLGLTPVGDRSLKVKVFGAPTAPGIVSVSSKREQEVTLIWNPSFLPYNLTPRYRVFINGTLEATVNRPSYVFARDEVSCDSYKVHVEAFNEVGTAESAQVEGITLPTVPGVTNLIQSLSSHITKEGGQVAISISFEPATTCDAHTVTNYTISITSNSSNPITKTEVAPTDPRDNVTVTVEGLSENTVYMYHISANNDIGNATTEQQAFYTTDVHSVTAMEMNEGTLFLRCEFVQGSNALGCQVNLETQTRLGNLTHTLYRTEPDSSTVDKLIDISVDLSCYHRVVVFDIESDNTTSHLGMPGDLQPNGSRPCTAPIGAPEKVPLALVIGLSVAVAVLIVLTVLILVVICCLLKASKRNGKVKDNSMWMGTNFPNKFTPNRKQPGGTQEDSEEIKPPVYDTVDNFRQTVSREGSALQDYQQLRHEIGQSLPLPPSPPGRESPVYSQLRAEAYAEPFRAAQYAEPYEVPQYAEPPPERVYHTLEDSTKRVSRPPKKTPPTTPPPAYYSEVADARPNGRHTITIGRSSTLTLPQPYRSGSHSSLSQV